jgi:mercuric reductase
MKTYDTIVIGSGSAGFAALEGLCAAGAAPLAMVERHVLGGECPNFGCVPTKALLKSAEVYNLMRNAEAFGVKAERVSFDWKAVVEREQELIGQTGAARAEQDLEELGVDLLRGDASFIDAETLQVGGKKYSAKRFVVATGSTPDTPEIPGLRETGFITSDEAITLPELPDRLVILGGGPVGLEMAQIFSRLGVKVTVLQRNNRVLPREEPEISEFVRSRLVEEGIQIVLSARVTEVERRGHDIRVNYEVDGKAEAALTDQILVASGRVPATSGLELERAGVEVDERGGVKVGPGLQTTAPHIWAAGDVIADGPQYTHAAAYEGWIVGHNMAGGEEKLDLRVVPRGTFTDPEVGSVGVTAAEAKLNTKKVQTSLSYYGGGRSLPAGDRAGIIKLVMDADSRLLLGAGLAGPYAAEVVHELALAMQAGLTVDQVGSTIHAFPTYSESILAALAEF